MVWHGWAPALLTLGVVLGMVLWLRRAARPARPLELADEELAPWFPYGTHPVVLPQTFVVTPGVTPAPPPTVGGATPVG